MVYFLTTLSQLSFCTPPPHPMGFPVAQLAKNPPAMRETWVQSLGWEDPLEKGKATHSSILAWRIPWTVYSPWGCRVGHNWATFTFFSPAPWLISREMDQSITIWNFLLRSNKTKSKANIHFFFQLHCHVDIPDQMLRLELEMSIIFLKSLQKDTYLE